jgi:hypothetical protein
VPRDLDDVNEVPSRDAVQKLGDLTIALVGRDPLERHTVPHGSIDQIERDLRLGPEDELLRYPYRLAACGIGKPTLRQVKVAVDQRMEVGGDVVEVHAHHAVVDLSRRAAILALDADRLLALLRNARLVDHADRVGAPVLVADGLPDPASHAHVVPDVLTQELLEIPRVDAGFERDRLDALSLQRPKLAAHIHSQVVARLLPTEEIVESRQELVELPPNLAKRRHVHVCPLS